MCLVGALVSCVVRAPQTATECLSDIPVLKNQGYVRRIHFFAIASVLSHLHSESHYVCFDLEIVSLSLSLPCSSGYLGVSPVTTLLFYSQVTQVLSICEK